MLSLKEYVKESLLDSIDEIAKKQDKAFIQEVKNWVKTNVSKQSGRIKIDSKTGEVTLPDTGISIKCPVLNGITFSAFEPDRIWMTYSKEEDVAAVCKNIDKKHEYTLRLQYTEINQLPKELDGMSGELMIDIFRQDIDFGNINLNLSRLHLDGANVKLPGTKNVNIISKDSDYSCIEGVTLSDDFGTIDAPKSSFRLRKVKSKKPLLVGLKNIKELEINGCECPGLDLRKANCEYLRLEGIDESFDFDCLPKQLKSLVIKTSEDYNSFDLSKIKTKVDYLSINGSTVDLNVSSEERDALYDMGMLIRDEFDEIPQRLIDYIAKHSKQVEDFDAMENGKSYITLCKSFYADHSKRYEDISYFKDFQKVEKDRSAMGRGIEIETKGWVASWGKDVRKKWVKYKNGGHQGYGNRPTEAEPERFYKNKQSGYYIDYYKIFEIPESFKPFIEKIMIDMTCSIWK